MLQWVFPKGFSEVIATAPDPFTGGETEAMSTTSSAVRQKSWLQLWAPRGRGFVPWCLDRERYPPTAGTRAAPCPSACSPASHAGRCRCRHPLREGQRGLQTIVQRWLQNCDSSFAEARQGRGQKSERSLLRCPGSPSPLSRDTRSPCHGGVPDGWHPPAARHGCCSSACRHRCGIIILPALRVLKTILEVIPFDLMLIPDNCFQA